MEELDGAETSVRFDIENLTIIPVVNGWIVVVMPINKLAVGARRQVEGRGCSVVLADLQHVVSSCKHSSVTHINFIVVLGG